MQMRSRRRRKEEELEGEAVAVGKEGIAEGSSPGEKRRILPTDESFDENGNTIGEWSNHVVLLEEIGSGSLEGISQSPSCTSGGGGACLGSDHHS